MKKRFPLCRLCPAALTILLAGCSLLPAAPASTAPTAPPAPTAAPAPAATPAPTPAATPEPSPAPEPGLDYDEMRPVEVGGSTPGGVVEGYFTVSKDGLWGLIRADGAEVLPCRAEAPVARCLPQGHWMWNVPGMGWEEQDAMTAALEAAGEAGICPGHGGGNIFFFYDLDAPGRDVHALDLAAFRAYSAGDGPGDIVEISDEMWETYGDLLPAFSAHEEGEAGDPVYPGDPVIHENADGSVTEYMYISREGWGFYVPNAQMAGFFYDEQLAPVQLPGGWTYVDRSGQLLSTTDYYDPTYATGPKLYNDPPVTEAYYAAPLQNGYVAVRRGDAWGLLDSTGAEVIPCAEAGVAWEGTTLWVKDATGWHKRELPQRTAGADAAFVIYDSLEEVPGWNLSLSEAGKGLLRGQSIARSGKAWIAAPSDYVFSGKVASDGRRLLCQVYTDTVDGRPAGEFYWMLFDLRDLSNVLTPPPQETANCDLVAASGGTLYFAGGATYTP